MVLNITILVALTIGIVEVIKGFELDKRFLPIVAIIIGLVFSIISNIGGDTIMNIFAGIGIGLASCGLFDFGKKTIAGK